MQLEDNPISASPRRETKDSGVQTGDEDGEMVKFKEMEVNVTNKNSKNSKVKDSTKLDESFPCSTITPNQL